ncbi:MAG: hypothetical protein Q7S33_05565 [Nanoarchaeota archaeon]|nr:hypothetical protein [Nanoarchaeota archaeon]
MKEFDYYIFIDYSVNLVGYTIIEKKKLFDLVPRISKFAHYKELKNKSSYIHSIKEIIKKNDILNFFLKHKIREMRQNMDLYLEVFDFIKKHTNCIIFISIDDHEYPNFEKFVKIVDGNKTIVKPESKLIKNTPEYRASLVLDTLLNIERLKRQNEK